MERGTLVVRADAGLRIGTGHVMRCLALAQRWRADGGRVVFVVAQSTPAVDQLLKSEQIGIARIAGAPGSGEDARRTLQIGRDEEASWFVVDGYQFDASYQQQLQNTRPLLTVDDNGLLDFYPAEVVVNQNAHARLEMYAKKSSSTRLLLGPEYALLRDEFAAYRNWTRTIPVRGSHLLLTMGGSDAGNFTSRILPCLAERLGEDSKVRVVLGGSAENHSAVNSVAAKFPRRIEVLRDVKDMAHLMAWADLAIAGAGTTCWEMCALGLPSILIVVADNQKFIAQQLAAIGAAENAGTVDQIDCNRLAGLCAQLLDNHERRSELSGKAKQVVDGCGRDRVFDAMRCGDEMCA